MDRLKLTKITGRRLEFEHHEPLAIGALCYCGPQKQAAMVVRCDGDRVIAVPLDKPEGLQLGMTVTPTDGLPDQFVSQLQGGEVIDLLGRVLWRDQSLSNASDQLSWGLGRLERAFGLAVGQSCLLAGDESVGPARLVCRALCGAAAQWVVAVTFGGLRELSRMRQCLAQSGLTSKSVVVWCPCTSPSAMSSLLPSLLLQLVENQSDGQGLVVIDDLRRWVEMARIWSEESPHSLLPQGFSPAVRQDLSRVLQLPSLSRCNLGLLAGWSLDRLIPSLAQHPFGSSIERWCDHGIVLKSRDEKLIPVGESWGESDGPLRCRNEIAQLLENSDPEAHWSLESLQGLIEDLFLSLTPEYLDDRPVRLWNAGHSRKVRNLASQLALGEKLNLDLTLWRGLDFESGRGQFFDWLEKEGR